MTLEQTIKIFKALGDSVRLQIFEMLRDGQLCACKIQEKFNITQPTLSHHMRVLCDCMLVNAVKQGKWVYYSLNCEIVKQIGNFMTDIQCNRKCDCK